MRNYFYSLRHIIVVALAAMVLLAFCLVYYSTEVYRELTINNQTEALQSLLALKIDDIVERTSQQQVKLADELQDHPQFKKALDENDPVRMEAWLVQRFSELNENNPDFQLQVAVVRNLIGDVFSRVSLPSLAGFNGCPPVESAISRNSKGELKPRHTLCQYQGTFYSEVLVPVNRLSPKAYVQVLVDVVSELQNLEHQVDFPIKVLSASGEELYRSPHWRDDQASSLFRPTYRLFTSDHLLGVDVVALVDQDNFMNNLNRTKTHLLVLTGFWSFAISAVVIFLSYLLLKPLSLLRNSVGALLTGKYASIDITTLPRELHELAQAYNDMVTGLENETLSRFQLEEKLRSEKDFIATTLNSIQNPVIVVDSNEKIKLLNPSAQLFFGELEKELIGKPLNQQLILYSNRQITHIVDISQLISHKKTWTTMFYHHPDNRVVELEFSASPMIDLETEDVGFLIILKDVSEDRQLRRKLNYEGRHDQLTGFLNRVAFEQKFETLVVESTGSHQQHVLAYLDIDRFKVVNETCGNTAGDNLIKQVGSIIRQRVRKSDIVSRLSGDEFGFIMPFFEMRHALKLIQNIIIDVQYSGFVWEDKEYQVTASIGVMGFGSMLDDYASYYSKVTTACYLAKENGGNQYHYIDDDDQKVVAQQISMDWVSGIMKGFTEDRFCLYVQPIVSMDADEDFSHYEVLIRYRSPDGTIVSPGDFLPPAERYNLIEKIDSWVVKKIIDWLQVNHRAMEGIMFSVNLSGRSIGSPTFHRYLQEVLSESGIDLQCLCFEITETAAVDNIEKSVEFIAAIKKLGAKISLDDFGTGLSSFSYLKQFPVDYLKIDGEFIRDIIDDDKSFVFVRSMTELGHCLDMKVIAEFVESDTMFDRLRDANVDYIQGYTVGRPVAIESLLKGPNNVFMLKQD